MVPWDGDDLAGRAEEALEQKQMAEEERRRRRENPQPISAAVEDESLRLSRARVLDQLSRATNPAHRAMLEKALLALGGQA